MSNNTKKSPIEFYDEELSRLIRQVQEKLEEAEVSNVDRLLGSANMFLQQIEHEVNKKKKQAKASSGRRRRLIPLFQRQAQQQSQEEGDEDEWIQIIEFRKTTLQHLMSERDKLNVYG